MSPTIEEQIERLKSTIAEMEAQREALGDAVVQESRGAAAARNWSSLTACLKPPR